MRILVFHTGSLGDTLIALPALWAIREYFANSSLTLLYDTQVGNNRVIAADVLQGSGLIDDFITYPVDNITINFLLQAWQKIVLLEKLRQTYFDSLAYLIRVNNGAKRINRDRLFFRMAGIRKFIGMDGLTDPPKKIQGQPLPEVPQFADQLLMRLAASGIPVPSHGHGKMDLGLNEQDQKPVDSWLGKLPSDRGLPWIGVGPGSKMPAKVWPAERFIEVVQRLIQRYDVWPVVFGGPEDQELGNKMIYIWRRGFVAAGQLGPRASAVALRRCVLYLGNDTGTMHLAAAVGVQCVSIFSAHNVPGAWYPYGIGHKVLRIAIECEGCLLDDCIERRMECIKQISVADVWMACREIMEP